MLKENTKAPSFKLSGSDNQTHELSKLKDKYVVLYFYPRDNTPGCTQEACDFRDNLNRLKRKNCIVYGISKDSLASHGKFSDKYDLNFVLLSDPDLTMHKAYQALNEEQKTIRSTFLIDPKGKLLKIWPKVKVKGHVEEILQYLKEE